VTADAVAPPAKYKGRLTEDEMQEICDQMRGNALAGFLALWNVLLTKAGQRPNAGKPGCVIRPDEYSIPFAQARQLVACLEPSNPELHFAWMLAWMDRGPTWHHE
jgi:hypothetical protein